MAGTYPPMKISTPGLGAFLRSSTPCRPLFMESLLESHVSQFPYWVRMRSAGRTETLQVAVKPSQDAVMQLAPASCAISCVKMGFRVDEVFPSYVFEQSVYVTDKAQKFPSPNSLYRGAHCIVRLQYQLHKDCMRSFLKRKHVDEQPGSAKYATASTNNNQMHMLFTKCPMCCTADLATAGALHMYCCYERFAECKVDFRNQIAQVGSLLPYVLSIDVPDPWPAAKKILECMRAGVLFEPLSVRRYPRALHQSLFMSLMTLMLHNDTHSAQAAACSALLHQSLTNVPGSWQPLQMSCVMQLIHSIAAAPLQKLLAITDALGIVHQAIRDAARLGIGPVILLGDALPAAELYRQPLVAALGLFISWGTGGSALRLSKLNCSQAVLSSAKGRACTAALQLVGSIGRILVEQGRLTSTQAAELLAAAH
eukprot:3936-Heterococcus_DN1.PRE.3